MYSMVLSALNGRILFGFLHGSSLEGLQFLFDFLIAFQVGDFILQRGFPVGIDQVGFGLHALDTVLELLEPDKGIRTLHPPDFLLGPAFSLGVDVSLVQNSLFITGRA